MLFRLAAKPIENDPRLHAGDAALRIDLQDVRHILRKIEDYGSVASLASKSSAGTTREERRAVLATKVDGCYHIFFVARNYDPDRDLAIVGAISGIKSATAGVEADFAAQMATQRGFER